MSLTNKEAAAVLGMVARGDNRHDIAAYFGVNQARIKEVEDGSHGAIPAATELPPKGPIGPKAQRVRLILDRIADAIEQGNVDSAKTMIGQAISIMDRPA